MNLPAYPDPYCVGLVNTLAPRQREVLLLVGKGMTAVEIGKLLGLSHQTVENHMLVVRRKFDVTTSIEASVIACKAGLL